MSLSLPFNFELRLFAEDGFFLDALYKALSAVGRTWNVSTYALVSEKYPDGVERPTICFGGSLIFNGDQEFEEQIWSIVEDVQQVCPECIGMAISLSPEPPKKEDTIDIDRINGTPMSVIFVDFTQSDPDVIDE